MKRGYNKRRKPNPFHHHLDSTTGLPSLPEFTGTALIESSEVGGLTGLWNLDFTLQDGDLNPLASSAVVSISLIDTTNATVIASAQYNVGDVVGTDAPISESNWITAVVPHLTLSAISDGGTVGFALYDFLIDQGDLFDNLIRTLTFSISVTNSSLPSATDTAIVDYSFYEVSWDTTKTGTHSFLLKVQANDYGIFDWGDGFAEAKLISGSVPLTNSHSFGSAGTKNVQLALPTGNKVLTINAFAQAITSIALFDTSACLSFRFQGNAALSSLPNFDLSSCTFLDLRDNAFVTLNSSFDVSNVITMRLGGNDLTSVPSGWDVSSVQTLELQNNVLSSLPTWTTTSLQILNVGFNSLTSLPSGWDVSNVIRLIVKNNASLAAIPGTWNPTALDYIEIGECNFSAIPSLNYSSCTEFTSTNNNITEVEAIHDFSVMEIFQITGEPLTTWNQTAISTAMLNLNLNTDAIGQSEVDDILAQLRVSYDANNRVITADLTNNSIPSATGLADKAYLNGNSCVITTDV